MTSSKQTPRKRVAVVGAGCAGMSAAYAMSLSPDKFEVTVIERASNTGGMATSTEIDPEKYGASYINDGVQGASPVFSNTFTMFERLGFFSSEVGMQVSFLKGEEFWSNVFPSDIIEKFSSDIKRFGKVLKIIGAFEPIFALISVEKMLKLFRFSDDFGQVIVYPLVALFFGTGNQTPFISSAILERVFEDPSMRLFEYSSDTFLASIPEMRAFPRLSLVYETWAKVIESTGCTTFKLCNEVTHIKRSKKGVNITYRPVDGVDLGQQVVDPGKETEDFFDEIILACDADAAVKILGKDASWLEKKVLGNVRYLWDVTVTHSDEDYMRKYYEIDYKETLKSSKRDDDKEAQDKFKFAKDNFKPLYYIHSYPDDKKKIEMSFDLSYYQAQFKGVSEYGPGGTGQPDASATRLSTSSTVTHVDLPPKSTTKEQNDKAEAVRQEGEGDEPPKKKHVFQTIFLDKDGSKQLWTRDEIDKDKIILEKWWKQQSHWWGHYGGTVPWMMFINGRNHTHFAGAWMILNMHELAMTEGLAAAYRLGASYPFLNEEGCKRLFALTLAASHGVRMRSEDRQGFLM